MNLQEIYKKLKLTDDCLIRPSSDPDWRSKVSFPSRLMHLLENNDLLKTLDAFFCFDNKPLILFFAGYNDKKALHKAIWNLNEAPIVIVIENNAVEIYNGYNLNKETELLERIGGADNLSDFTYFELVTGKTWEKYQKELSHKNRVDYRLLGNIEETQKKLESDGINQETANALLGKIIFIRYLIDRRVRLHFNNIPKYWTNNDLCNLLKSKHDFWSFLQYLENPEKGFNGDMFKMTKTEFDNIPEQSLTWLIRLLQGEDIATGQLSFFDLYDFSILPIEFISNVYEKFIGKENQDKNGAYYTPTFIVDYIVAETIGKKLKESNDYKCKVLDPSCGSGIFLVESLRKIIEKYKEIHNITKTDTDDFRKTLSTIAKENIFGIDKDKSAIQVAIFSIYLTLLNYQEPADIEHFKFPNLIGTNFICSDTFDINNTELKAFENKKHQFDYIVGNPPWKRGGIPKGSSCEQYLKQRKLHKIICNRELAQAFVLRCMDFTTANTQCALVLVSKVLYNLDSNKFRTFILDHLYINQVFELAPVRKEVFNKSNDPAVAPACILFFKNAFGENTDKNIVTHIALKPSRFFTMFKVFSLARNDIQEIQQDRLKTNDWLWKVLVYGSYLDFIFIQRLKKNHKTIRETIESQGFVKQGYKNKDGERMINTNILTGWNLLQNKTIKPFYCEGEMKKWDKPCVGYIYRKNGEVDTSIYTAPFVVIKNGIQTDLKIVSAICYKNAVYNDSITAISGIFDVDILRNIVGSLNSSISVYQNLMTFSSSGIEREFGNDEEKLSLPYCPNLAASVKDMEELVKKEHDATLITPTIEQRILEQNQKIDIMIYNEFDCSQLELDLIDYAMTISVPMARKAKGHKQIYRTIKKDDILLSNYAQVYIDRFAKSFNKEGKHFVVDIHHSEQMIGMFFRIIDEKDFTEEIPTPQTDNKLLALAINLSSQRITDQLFVQKDLWGVEKDFFYIIKPNERRLWHKAIAHMDVNEFDDAMLRAGRIN